MEFTSEHAPSHLDDFVAAMSGAVVGLDFDGVLAPIVDDPAQAHIHPDAPQVLPRLAERVRALAVITGRPARQALALGDLDRVGESIADSGRVLHIYGQYGNEHWSSAERRIVAPDPPAGLATLTQALPGLLRAADAAQAHVEDKGLAVAVHTRQLADPFGAFDRLFPLLDEAARDAGLVVEPGRLVIEIRSEGMDKGKVVDTLVRDLDPTGFLFIGDDLGDVPAFEAVLRLRADGLATLLVCSASEEQAALRELADVVVPGPTGVVRFLDRLVQMSDANPIC